MKIFGFKAYSAGSHTLIAGHAVTKDGNCEFSTSFDHSSVNTLLTGLRGLATSLESIRQVDNCHHNFRWDGRMSGGDRLITCYMCQTTKPCDHSDYATHYGSDQMISNKHVCNRCQYEFTFKTGTDTKIPFTGTTGPDVRAGEGASQ